MHLCIWNLQNMETDYEVWLSDRAHDELDSSEKLALITTIHDDANWLLNMVENLLSVTRIQNDGHKVAKEPELVEEVVSDRKSVV